MSNSKILATLVAACGLAAVDHTDQKAMGDLVDKVAELSEAAWKKLTPEAQDYYNACADAVNDEKDVPAPPDLEEAPAARRAPARRGAAKDDTPAVGGPDLLKEGQTVKIENKRGKVIEGVVTELTAEDVVLDNGDECSIDKVVKVTVIKDVDGGSNAGANEPEGPADPEVGDTVSLTTKRGKVVEGVVTELTDDDIVLEGGDEYARDKITDLKVVKKAGGKKDEKAARGKKDEPAEAEEKKRSSNPKGVSVGGRIRELMCDKLGISAEDVSKALKKEGLEFREVSLNMIYKETAFVIDQLRKNGHMKK